MKKIYFLTLLAVSLLLGCTDAVENDVQTPASVEVEAAEIPSYVIPVDDALDNLQSMLVELNPIREERGLKKLNISEVTECLVANRADCATAQNLCKTPSVDSSISQDTLLYIVNFPDSSGYAILAADKRIPEEVLVVSDCGNLSLEEFNNAGNDITLTYGDDDNTTHFDFANTLVKEYVFKKAPVLTPPFIDDRRVRYSEWKTYESRSPLVPVRWHQGSPFNDECPICNVCGKPKAAGCVAIAIAQIFATNRNIETFVGATIEWSTMNASSIPNGSDRMKIARWVRYIGDQCFMEYNNCSGDHNHSSGANVNDAKNFLSELRPFYNNVELIEDYAYMTILDMLRDTTPIYIRGTSESGSGHAWVLDGFVRQYQILSVIEGSDPNNIVEQDTLYRDFVHCNYGWGGTSDGYYSNEVFDATEGPAYGTTTSTVSGNDYIYTSQFKIIKYTLH